MHFRLALVLWLMHMLLCTRAKDVIVSTDRGKDVSICGNSTHPCKSVRFTIEQIITDYDVIHLDGGVGTKSTYILNHTINVQHSFQMRKWSQSKFYPIITTSKRVKFQIYDISHVKRTYNCTFIQIIFKHAHISFSGASGFVTIEKCMIYQTIFHYTLSTIYHSAFSLRVSRSKLRWSKIEYILYDGYAHVLHIEKSTIENSSIRNICKKVYRIELNQNLTFVRTNFTNSSIRISEGKRFRVNGSRFKNSSITLSHIVAAYIRKCEFFDYFGGRMIHVESTYYSPVRGSVTLEDTVIRDNLNDEWLHDTCLVELNLVLHTSVYNCIFANNMVKYSSRTFCTKAGIFSVSIRNSIFLSNRSTRGGAISTNGDVDIINSTFINNSAREFGGTIYSIERDTSGLGMGSKLTLTNVSIIGSTSNRQRSRTGTLIYTEAQITASNVRFETKVNTELSATVFFKNSRKVINLRNVTIVCPVGHKASSFGGLEETGHYFESFCISCGRGMYNLSHGEERTDINGSHVFRNDIKCSKCVSGGTCDGTIKSVGNYWGYVNKTGHVRFIPCPVNYCCSSVANGSQCSSYDSCEYNRSGVLCGGCSKGFSLNFLSSACVSSENCVQSFYFLYALTQFTVAIAYVLLLLWLKEILLYIKRLVIVHRKNKPCSDPLNEPLLKHDDRFDEECEPGIKIRQRSILTTLNKDGHGGDQKKGLISGLIKIAFFFYQVEPLLRIHAPLKARYSSTSWIFQTLISSIFNIKWNGNRMGAVFCPSTGLTTMKKNVLKVSFVLTMFVVLLLLYWLHKLITFWKQKYDSVQPKHNVVREDSVSNVNQAIPTYARLPFPVRVKCCAAKLSLLSYATISVFIFKSINCVSLDASHQYLYVQGDIQCYTHWQCWQWLMIGFAVVWVMPFCAALYGASSLLSSCKITPDEFLFVLLFPPALLFFYARCLVHSSMFLSDADAMTAKHMLMDFYDAFKSNSSGEYVKWECLLIFRKLTLVCATTFIIHPIEKLYTVLALLTAFLFHHFYNQPYGSEIVNVVESCSLVFLGLMTSVNLFWAHIYMSSDIDIPHFRDIAEVFLYFEMGVLVIPIIMVVLVLMVQVAKKLVHVCINRDNED